MTKILSAKSTPTQLPAPISALKLFDADDTNPSFARFYPKAEQLLLSGKGLEPLFNWFVALEQVAVVDFGARASKSLVEFDDSTGFFKAAKRFNTKIVICFVLAPEEDSIALLKRLIGKISSGVHWVVVRSTFKPGIWDLWEDSNTRQSLTEMGASEMLAPTLDAEAWSALGRLSQTAYEAVKDSHLTLVQQSHVFRWREKFAAEFEAAVRPLIQPDGKTLFCVTGDKGGVGKSALARALADWLVHPESGDAF